MRENIELNALLSQLSAQHPDVGDRLVAKILATPEGQLVFNQWMDGLRTAQQREERLAVVRIDGKTAFNPQTGRDDRGIEFIRQALSQAPKGMKIAVTGIHADLFAIALAFGDQVTIVPDEKFKGFMAEARRHFKITSSNSNEEILQTMVGGAVDPKHLGDVQSIWLKTVELSKHTIVTINIEDQNIGHRVYMADLVKEIQSKLAALEKTSEAA